MKMLKRGYWSTIWTGSAAFAVALSGCAGNAPARDASSNEVAYDPNEASSTAPDRETTVQVSKAFRERCSLPEDTQGAPVFELDQSTLRASGRNVLDDVAICLTEGPLKGEVITVIGRADARGSAEHNADLGTNRAAAARNYLVKRGVQTERVHLMSRGAEGARGTDEASFKLDRRVDLELGDLKNSPILEGTMLHAESAPAPSKTKAGTYADTADGPVGGAVTGSGSAAAAAAGK